MSTLPIFGFTPNRFTLHNASPQAVDLRWGGVQFTVPPTDMVGPKAALDADGQPIPGTVQLEDSVVTDKDGSIPEAGSPPNWHAFEAVRNLLGVDPVTKEMKGELAKAGISFMPNAPTKDVVAQVKQDGTRRYEEHLLNWAQYTVSAYEARVQSAKMAGVQPAPPDQDYARALIVLRKHETKLKAAMSTPEVGDDEEAMALAVAKAEALKMAERAAAGKDIDKNKLAEELMTDPKTRAYLLSKGYRIRKKGYLDVPDEAPEELSEAP